MNARKMMVSYKHNFFLLISELSTGPLLRCIMNELSSRIPIKTAAAACTLLVT
jgi:hypothetical protein